MRKLVFLILAAAALLSGCNPAEMFDRFMPKEETQWAKELVAKVAARDYEAVDAAMKPEFRSPALKQQIDDMVRLLPTEPVKSIKVVGYQVVKQSSDSTISVTLEYEYDSRWILAGVRMERVDGHLLLVGISFFSRDHPLEEENRFTFEGKGALHCAVLALAVAIPVLVIYALVLCIRTKFAKRKWPWVLFILVGLVQFNFNWSSGAWDIQPVAFMLLGAGFLKSGPFAPWMFTLSFPLGAVLFLYRRPALQRPAGASQTALSSAPTESTERDVTHPGDEAVPPPDEYR